MQAEIAIEEADVIIFCISHKDGITPEDEIVARILYKSKKPVILAVNKYDKKEPYNESFSYMALGFGEPVLVSATHGIGTGDLLDRIVNEMPKQAELDDATATRITIIGKPNVGKSSLVNAILNENRMIVSDIAGTTVDSVDSKVK
ncbi:hypothetical protein Zmor_008765 [Zophobas morio]|uniref:GTPase Der n=1 Tax=Zophobas morio TaxID=2755281 RepID=A0AA38HM91_9CUCU|nr:hypothetical protein Zmor_008765 [Zophobas morio]